MDEAHGVELLCERFGENDRLPLSLLQWFLSRLYTPIRLGPIRGGDRSVIVTRVLGEYSVSEMRATEPKPKKKSKTRTRNVDVILVPQTSISVSFASYRVVLCLDLATVAPLHVQHIFVSVIASNGCDPEGAGAINIWSGDLLWKDKDKDRDRDRGADISSILRVVQERVSAAQDEILQESTTQQQGPLHPVLKPALASTGSLYSHQSVDSTATLVGIPRDASYGSLASTGTSGSAGNGNNNNLTAANSSSSTPSSSSSSSAPRHPDLRNFACAMAGQLESLPQAALPVAVLFTSGNMKIQVETPHCILHDAPVTLHIIAEAISASRSVGFYSDLVGLEVVAEELHGGTLGVVESRKSRDILTGVSAVCNKDFFNWHVIGAPRKARFSTVVDPASSFESHLQSYLLDGATAEHLLCCRLSEGFSIINISQDIVSLSPENAADAHLSTQGRFPRAVTRQVTVCMKKAMTKLSSLVYELTFTPRVKATKPTSFGIRKLQTAQRQRLEAQAEEARASKRNFLDRERMAFEEFSWTTGSVSVDLRKIGPRSKQDESIVKRIARTAQVICETDQRIAAVLGESFMPGCVLAGAVVRSNPPAPSHFPGPSSPTLDTTYHGDQKRKRGSFIKAVSHTEKHLPLFPAHQNEENRQQKRHVRPSPRRLAAHADILATLFTFDRCNTLHLFSAPGTLYPASSPDTPQVSTTAAEKRPPPVSALHQTILQIFLDNLPYPSVHQLAPGKWLVVVCNCSDAMIASEIFPSSEVELGLLQVEIATVCGLFTSIRIFSMGPCAHAMTGVVASLFQKIDAKFGVDLKDAKEREVRRARVLRLSQDFSYLFAAGRARLNSSLRSTRSLASLPPHTSRKLRSLLVNEVVVAKQALGFVVSVSEAEDGAGQEHGPGDIISTQLCCISASHPAGILPESLVQCRIECTSRTLSVEYAWPKGCTEGKEELHVIAFHEKAAAASDSSTRRLENLVFQLLAQDEEIFAFYNVALPLMADARLETPKSLQRRRTINTFMTSPDTAAVLILGKELFGQQHFELINSTDWAKMVAHATTETLLLPCLDSAVEFADDFIDAISDTDYSSINKVLRELLCKSLLRPQGGHKKAGGLDLRLAYIAPRLSAEAPSDEHKEGPQSSPRPVASTTRLCLYAFVTDALLLLEFEPEGAVAAAADARGGNDEEKKDGFSDVLLSPSLSVLTLEQQDLQQEQQQQQQQQQQQATESSPSPACISSRDMSCFQLKIHFLALPLPPGEFASEDLLDAARVSSLLTLPPALPRSRSKSTETLVESSSLESAGLTVQKRLKARFSLVEFRSKVLSSHLSNFTRVLFYAARNRIPLREKDVLFALQHCSQTSVEVDISTMCRCRVWGSQNSRDSLTPATLEESDAINAMHLLRNTFLTTLGTKLTSIQSKEVFVLSDASANSFSSGSPLSISPALLGSSMPLQDFLQDLTQSLNDGACLFGRFHLSHRGFEETSTLSSISVASSASDVAQAIVSLCSDLWLSNTLDSSEICLGMTLFTFPASARPHGASSFSGDNRDEREPASSARKLLTYTMSQELRAFVATDMLNSLLLLPEPSVTAETLIHVQQCLRDVPSVKSMLISLDFVVPSNATMAKRTRDASLGGGGGSNTSQQDFIASFFEREVRSQAGNTVTVMKIGEIMFTRSWYVSDLLQPASPSGALAGSVPVSRAPSPGPALEPLDTKKISLRQIPCWVLISISHSIFGSTSITSGSSTTSGSNASTSSSNSNSSSSSNSTQNQNLTLKISVSIRKTEGAASLLSSEHDKIARSVEDFLQQCCFRINQRILLRELHVSKVAIPLLLPLHGPPALQPPAAPHASQEIKSFPAQIARPQPLNTTRSSTGPSVSSPVVGGGSRQRAVTSLINLIPPRTSTRSKLAAAEAPPQMPHQPAIFACPRQGVITCTIHSSMVQYETAIRYLEKSAMNQFALENHERYFVSEDEQGNVHYMMFDRDPQAAGAGAGSGPSASESSTVRLSVFGLQTMEKNMSDHLRVLLTHRLMEITAKTISPVLSRTSMLYASYGNFLRENRSVRHSFSLPAFVSDIYFYMTLARQVMVASQVLSRLTVPNHRQISRADLLHPATAGYSLNKRDTTSDDINNASSRLDPLSPLSPLEASTSAAALIGIGKIHTEDRPILVRNTGVVPTRGADKINPVFLGRQNWRRTPSQVQEPQMSADALPSAKEVVWQQSDFTLLYNIMAPLPPASSQHLKAVSKLAGQGLALVEICPSLPSAADQHKYFTPQSQILTTGSVVALDHDIKALGKFLETDEKKMAVIPVPPPESQSSPRTPGTSPDSLSTSNVSLCIYPSIPMHTAALVDFVTACLNQALIIYVSERLFSACGSSAASADVFGDEREKSGVSTLSGLGLDVLPLVRVGSSVPPAMPLPSINQLVDGKGTRRLGLGLGERIPSGVSVSGDVVGRVRAASQPLALLAAEIKNVPRRVSALPCTAFDDFLRLWHACLSRQQASALVAPFCGCAHIPCRLPKRRAQLVHRQILSRVLEAYPHLRSTLTAAECEPLFDDAAPEATFSRTAMRKDSALSVTISIPGQTAPLTAATNDTTSGDLRWFCDSAGEETDAEVQEGGYGITVCVLGEQLRDPPLVSAGLTPAVFTCSIADSLSFGDLPETPAPVANIVDTAAIEATPETRFLSDVDGPQGANLPTWLRRRRCILEISVSAEGVFVLYSNVLPKVIGAIVDIAQNCCSAALIRQRQVDEGYLTHLRSHLNPFADSLGGIDSRAIEEEAGLSLVECRLLRQCLSRLSWERRVMDRLYLNRHTRATQPLSITTPATSNPDSAAVGDVDKAKCLAALPREAWRRGVHLESFCVPLLSTVASTHSVVDTDSFAAYVDRLRTTMGAFSCDLVGPGSSYCYRILSGRDRAIYFVLPVPRTSLIIATEVQLVSPASATKRSANGSGSGSAAAARVTHRAIKIMDILWAPRRAAGLGRFSIGCFGEADSFAAGAWAGWLQEQEMARENASTQRLFILHELGASTTDTNVLRGDERARRERNSFLDANTYDGEEDEGEDADGTTDEEHWAGLTHPVCEKFMLAFKSQAFALLLSSLHFTTPLHLPAASPSNSTATFSLLTTMRSILALAPQVRCIQEVLLASLGKDDETGYSQFFHLVALVRGEYSSSLTVLERPAAERCETDEEAGDDEGEMVASPKSWGDGDAGEAVIVLRFRCACVGVGVGDRDEVASDGESSAAEAIARTSGLCFIHNSRSANGRDRPRMLFCVYDSSDEQQGGEGEYEAAHTLVLSIRPDIKGSLLDAVRVQAQLRVEELLGDMSRHSELHRVWSQQRVLRAEDAALLASISHPLPSEAWRLLGESALLEEALEVMAASPRYFAALLAELRRELNLHDGTLEPNANLRVFSFSESLPSDGQLAARHLIISNCCSRRCALHVRIACGGQLDLGALSLAHGFDVSRTGDEDETRLSTFACSTVADSVDLKVSVSASEKASHLSFLQRTLGALVRACAYAQS